MTVTTIDQPLVHRRPGLVAAVRGELLRIRRWSATWVIAAAWLLLAAVFNYLFPYLSYATGDAFGPQEGAGGQLLAGMMPDNVPAVLLQGTPLFGGALMMVFGALVAGNGYGWGSWKTVLTLGPSRTATLSGSLLAVTAVVAGVVLATVAVCLAIALGVAVAESQPVVWPDAGDLALATGTAFLILQLWALFGYLLGTLAKGPALSVGLGLVWALVLENLLRGVGALLGPVESFTTVLPGTAAGSLAGAVSRSTATAAADAPGVLDVLSGVQATWTVAAYLLILPLLTLLLVRRRDVA